MRTIELSAKQRQEIQERRRLAGDRRIFQRLSTLLWIDEGRTREVVADLLGVTSRQVGDWLRIFRNKGLDELCTLHYRGDPGRLRPAQVEQLKQEIAKGVFHNTEHVRSWIKGHFGVTYSCSGVKDLLHRIGASYHKVSGFFWKADRKKQRQFVRKYRRQRREAGPKTRRYFVDACHPVWGLELLYCCWLLVGQRHYVGVGSGRKRLNILGAYSYPFQGALVSNPMPCYPWGSVPQGDKATPMDEILQTFLDKAPAAVIVGATIARTIGDSTLDDIFERHAGAQYTRDLTFSALSRLMTQVVFCTYPSVHAAYQQDQEISVSIASVYNKLNGLETGVSQALAAETARSMDEILMALPDPPDEPVKGLRLRTLDGNFLAGTDHRLACLRGCGAAALPGMALVVRNFCTDDYLGGIQARDASFLVRHHAGTKLHPLGQESRRRHHPDGTISEQRVRVGILECRCILIRLKQPLRDGTTEIRLLTNVPLKQLSARRAAELYRTRWRIETAFQELTVSLRCEINTLGYPKAALFGFALAVVSYNLLVLTRAALASGLGEEAGEEALSSYHMATQVAAVSEGMMIAV